MPNVEPSPRELLLAGAPAEERRVELGRVSTTLLEAGTGPPILLLHGPGANATHWLEVIPDLARTRRVIAPDLPGHGASGIAGGPLDAQGVLAWLGDLIARTCSSPPVIVGAVIGGAIAARFAAEREDELDRLVLVDTLGLQEFEPAPAFGQALNEFRAEPSERTHDALWSFCARDVERVRRRMGGRWDLFRALNVAQARTPTVQDAAGAMWEQFGAPALPASDLERIAVPVTLVWGRHDLATPLAVAQAASERLGWPLHVIEDCADDPAVEQPEAFVSSVLDPAAALPSSER